MSRAVEAIRKIAIADIVRDAGTQMRVRGLDDVHVAALVDALARGKPLVAPDVFFDGERHILADGFHRIAAHERHGNTDVAVRLHDGDADDAVMFAANTNAEGRREYTKDDKRKAVGDVLRIRPEWTNSRVADHCHVDETMVRDARARVSAQLSPVSGNPEPDATARKPVAAKPAGAAPKREGRDGKQYSSEGKRVAGGRKQYENALAKIASASSLTDLRDAMDRGESALQKIPEDETRASELQDAYIARKRALESDAPARTARLAPPPPKMTDRDARVLAFIAAADSLDQRVLELLHDNPLAHADEATSARCYRIVEQLMGNLRTRVLDVLNPAQAAE